MHPKRNGIDAYASIASSRKVWGGAVVCKIAITHKIPLKENHKKTRGKAQCSVDNRQLAMNNG